MISQRPWYGLALVGLAYPLVGVLTGELAGSAQSTQGRNVWRLVGWGLSLGVFVAHLLYERLRRQELPRCASLRAATAVALGAFVLALVGPVRNYWGTERFAGVAVLSLVLWPIITGLPALVVAWLVSPWIRRGGGPGRSDGRVSPTRG